VGISEPATVATSGAVELLQKFRSEAGFETWDGLVLELFQWAIFGINNSKKNHPNLQLDDISPMVPKYQLISNKLLTVQREKQPLFHPFQQSTFSV